jgi:hypothetical protein
MVKLFELELDRNERDLKKFLKSRDVSLSKSDVKALILAEENKKNISLFDTDRFKKAISNGSNREKTKIVNKSKLTLSNK